MKDSPTPDWNTLLQNSGWVRALARSLVADPATADDIAQQAWLRAAEMPPKHAGNLRAWLATLVRTAAGQHWRKTKSHASLHGDEVAKDSGATPAASADIVERMDTVRSIASSVASLNEPYASAIYLRYFEELSVREVAQRQGVPVNTAQTRLARGLEKLRVKLEGSLGSDWKNQCLVFAVPLPVSTATTLGTTTAIAMTTKTKLTLAAGIVFLLSIGILQPWQEDDVDLAGADGTSMVASNTGEQAVPAQDDVILTRSDIPVETNAAGTGSIAASAIDNPMRVKVVDAVTLQPVANAEVLYFDLATDTKRQRRSIEARYLDSEALMERFGIIAIADEDGHVELPRPQENFYVGARKGDKFASLFSHDFKDDEEAEVELALLGVKSLKVQVLDHQGNPAPGIHVGFKGYPRRFAGFPDFELITNADGRVVFRHLEQKLAEDMSQKGNVVAVAVPAQDALFVEFPAAEFPTEELVFRLPRCGTIKVRCVDSNGKVIPNGIPVGLQGGPLEERFDQHLAQGYRTAYVHDGFATFEAVGVATDLVIHCSRYDSNLAGTLEVKGPSAHGEVVVVDLVLPAPNPPLKVKLEGPLERPIAAEFYTVMQEVHDKQGERHATGQSTWVNESGIFELERDLAVEHGASTVSVLITEGFDVPVRACDFAMATVDVSEASQRAEDDPITLSYGDDILLGGHVLDSAGGPVANFELGMQFVLREQRVRDLNSISPSLSVMTDAEGAFVFRGSFDANL